METNIELVPSGINELDEKLKKAQSLLVELKKAIDEIKECHVSFILKPVYLLSFTLWTAFFAL